MADFDEQWRGIRQGVGDQHDAAVRAGRDASPVENSRRFGELAELLREEASLRGHVLVAGEAELLLTDQVGFMAIVAAGLGMACADTAIKLRWPVGRQRLVRPDEGKPLRRRVTAIGKGLTGAGWGPCQVCSFSAF
jgi:hypothetical protein